MRLLALLLLCAACGDDSGVDSGMDASATGDATAIDAPLDAATDMESADAVMPVCEEEPDTECPEDLPVEGSACASGLSCSFPVGRGFEPWDYACTDSVWVPGPPPCAFGGGCAAPPLAERCRDPQTTPIASAVLSVGPTAMPFAPFEEGQEVELVLGGQGLAMLEFAVHLDGADDVTCTSLNVELDFGEVTSEPWAADVEVLCGDTRRLYYVMPPDSLCTEAPVNGRLRVRAEGLGEFERSLIFRTDLLCELLPG